MIPIYDWVAIAATQWQSLLLGNGASIALHRDFGYASLYEVASTNGLLPTTRPLFARFGTTDFEYVLLACWHADLINRTLTAPSIEIRTAYHEVRSALIQAVHDVHPDYATVQPMLVRIGEFASNFQTIVTLNYDLTLYWAMMLHNDRSGPHFKDAFLGGYFEPHWHHLRAPQYPATCSSMVFYPHGSLAIAREISGRETKVATGGAGLPANLLDTITNSWAAGSHVPLFVSEGDQASKMTAIRRSPYLSAVYDSVLSNIGDRIVIFGFGFSDNDDHILEAVMKSAPTEIAISVNTARPHGDQQAYCHHVMAKLARFGAFPRVMFFNAGSTSCWANP